MRHGVFEIFSPHYGVYLCRKTHYANGDVCSIPIEQPISLADSPEESKRKLIEYLEPKNAIESFEL